MRFIPFCFEVALLICPHVSAQEVSPHARRAVETIQQLRAIGLPSSRELQSGPPAKVPSLLRQLNQELKALIIDDLNDGTQRSGPGLEDIMEQLRAAGWDDVPEHKWNAYGEIRQIRFDLRTEFDPAVLVVSTQLWIPCGSNDPDSSIYVFRGTAHHWDLILSTDSDFDATGEGTESGFQYKISPPDSRGTWYLAVAHVPPSCVGPSNMLRYKVLRPGVTADNPRVLLARREKFDTQFDPPFRLDVQSDWLGVIHGNQRKLDGEVGVSISRFQLKEDKVQRIAPLALTPEDFLDQWSQSGWDEAGTWANASLGGALEKWHSMLSGLVTDSAEIESVQLCSGTSEGDQTWRIELWIDRQLNPSIKEEKLYIDVAKRNGIFRVDAINSTHPSGCSGKTPIMPRLSWDLPYW